MTNITVGILLVLHEHKEISGNKTLASMLGTKPERALSNAIILARLGLIDIVFAGKGGRKNKNVFRDKGIITVERSHVK